MTWHAAKFLLANAALLTLAAVAFFVFASAPHRGETWLRMVANRFAHHPRFGSFVRRHFISHERSLVRMAIGIIVFAAAGFFFLHILHGVLTDSKLGKADVRLHNTLRMFHSEVLHRRYSAITRVASIAFAGPFAIALAALLFTAGRRRDAVAILAALVSSSLFALVLKYVVHRPRPPDAIAFEKGPSFPSGHTLTAAVVYGFVVVLILSGSRRWLRVIAALPLVIYIALVPLSRVYLGVHWPYDTVASLALGVALLAALIAAMKSEKLEHLQRETAPWFARALAAFVVVAVIGAVLYARAGVEREARPPLPPPRESMPLDVVRQQFPPLLKRNSEDLAGGPMEPAAFVFAGDAGQLVTDFTRAGWSLADTPSATGLLHELGCVIRDAPDPQGLATPSYYDAQPQDLTFERPGTASGSIRHRHHIRIWREPVNVAPATPLWVATCSYDEGVEIVPKPYLVTHRIDPHVDTEREMIAAQLRAAGAADLGLITVTGPRHGQNAGGDSFTTDGRAHVIALR